MPGWADQNLVRPVSSFAFYPEINGIPTKKPLFYVEVDAKKGNVVLAKVNNVPSLPASLSKEGLVSVDKATEAYGEQAELRLAYWYPKIGKHTAKLPQLAYLPTMNAKALQVDAATGKVEQSWVEWTAVD